MESGGREGGRVAAGWLARVEKQEARQVTG